MRVPFRPVDGSSTRPRLGIHVYWLTRLQAFVSSRLSRSLRVAAWFPRSCPGIVFFSDEVYHRGSVQPF